MSTRITSSVARGLVAAWLVLAAPGMARAGGEYEEARLSAGGRARNLAVSAPGEALLKQKEAGGGGKRRQGIGLLEQDLRGPGPTPGTPRGIFPPGRLQWGE